MKIKERKKNCHTCPFNDGEERFENSNMTIVADRLAQTMQHAQAQSREQNTPIFFQY